MSGIITHAQVCNYALFLISYKTKLSISTETLFFLNSVCILKGSQHFSHIICFNTTTKCCTSYWSINSKHSHNSFVIITNSLYISSIPSKYVRLRSFAALQMLYLILIQFFSLNTNRPLACIGRHASWMNVLA